MQLRTVLQGILLLEATRLVEAEGGHNDFPSHLFILDTASTSGLLWVLVGGPLCGKGAHRWHASGPHLPVEIHTLLGELPVAVVRVLKGLILDNLHTFPSVALLVAVLADHVQLSDFVL